MKFSVLKHISILFFISIIFLIYSNTLEAPFVFDDLRIIKNNSDIRNNNFNISNLVKIVFNKKSSIRCIPEITFSLNYYFHKYRLNGYHLVNTVIHILTSILLYYFIKITLSLSALQSRHDNSVFIAFFATTIWIVHPLHTQSVTYIVQRMNSMSAMFYLFSMLLYAIGRMRQKEHMAYNSQSKTGHIFQTPVIILCFSGAVVAWLMALGSKQNAAVLPFFIFIYEWYFFQNLNPEWLKRNMKIVFALFVLLVLTAFVFLGTSPFEKLRSISDFASHEFTLMERVLTQPRVVIYYLSLLFYPHPFRLNLDYDFQLSHSLVDPATTLFSVFVIIGLVYFAICLASKDRLLSFCVLWFLGNLVIESSVIPLAIIFEHRTYLPSMLISLSVILFWQRYIKLKWPGVALACAVTVMFSLWTYQRNDVWSDPVKLWRNCVKKSPKKARPHNNLGLAIEKQGLLNEAINHYIEAVRINPDFVEAYYNIGHVMQELGRADEAVENYLEALNIKPDYWKAHHNLGNVMQGQGRADEAIKHYLKALNMGFDLDKVHNNWGHALLKQGNMDAAINHYKEALSINPDCAEAYYNIGSALQKDGRMDEAIKK